MKREGAGVLISPGYSHDRLIQSGSGEPYFVHPDSVADLVDGYVSYGHTFGNPFSKTVITKEQMKDAAWLHDIIEDVYPENSNFSLIDIDRRFGKNVAFMVWELTDEFTKDKYPEWNRAKRKWFESKRLGQISMPSRIIKLADMLHNLSKPLGKDGLWPMIMMDELEDNIEEWGEPSRDNPIFRDMVEEVEKRIKFWRKKYELRA